MNKIDLQELVEAWKEYKDYANGIWQKAYSCDAPPYNVEAFFDWLEREGSK